MKAVSQHTILSVDSSVPTLTLANYARGGSGKSAKLVYDTNDDFIISSFQNDGSTIDTMKMSDGTTTFNHNLTTNGNFVIGSGDNTIHFPSSRGSNNQILVSDASGYLSWADQISAGSSTLTDLTDTNLSNISTNNILSYNGSYWVNSSNLDLSGTITVGENDTGFDVKFYGVTNGKYMLWDESADTLKVEGTIQATNVVAISDGN